MPPRPISRSMSYWPSSAAASAESSDIYGRRRREAGSGSGTASERSGPTSSQAKMCLQRDGCEGAD
jgi:hypothetical protein